MPFQCHHTVLRPLFSSVFITSSYEGGKSHVLQLCRISFCLSFELYGSISCDTSTVASRFNLQIESSIIGYTRIRGNRLSCPPPVPWQTDEAIHRTQQHSDRCIVHDNTSKSKDVMARESQQITAFIHISHVNITEVSSIIL